MKKIAILQSNYIPWKGYFDLINYVDEFILFDDMQYTKRDWRNRNKIKTNSGASWLTIPVVVKGKYLQKINETIVSDSKWAKTHWKTIVCNYKKALFFNELEEMFGELYELCRNEEYLSNINNTFIRQINQYLNISTVISNSSDFELQDEKTSRLIGLCKDTGADVYVSGPAAKDYLDTLLFEQEGIAVEWMNYEGYPEYNQLYPPFSHNVSILDLIFNVGPESINYMKSFD